MVLILYIIIKRFIMGENYDYLINLLEESVKKNGEKPLTDRWLLNILKNVTKQLEYEEDMPDEIILSDKWYYE